jgi:hypothetical protein
MSDEKAPAVEVDPDPLSYTKHGAIPHNPQILQIIPAEGWVALFGEEEEDPEAGPDMRAVACWALVECEGCDTRSVVPMVAVDGALMAAPELDGYQDIALESDVLDEIFPEDPDSDDGDT